MCEGEKWKWIRSVISDSSRLHGLQPTRLLHPWDFLGKSTGVTCHCLLWWEDYSNYLGQGVEISRNPSTAHFLVFWWWLGTVLEPLDVSFSLLIEDKGLIKVDLSAILDPFNSNQFMLCPQAVSFFRKLCPTPPPPPSFQFQNHWSLRVVEFTCKNLQISPKALKNCDVYS